MPDLAGEVRLLYLCNLLNQKELEYFGEYESYVMLLIKDNNGAFSPNCCPILTYSGFEILYIIFIEGCIF